MDTKLKAKWINILRSGKIKQARGALLRTNGGMCCLGVLERVCGVSDAYLLRKADSLTPVQNHRGLDMDVRRKLATLNDGSKRRRIKQHTFKQIATWIEKHL